MLKIYKKVIRIDTSGQNRRFESLPPQNTAASGKLVNRLSGPAMIAGAVVGALVFSAFFALLLIPLAFVGIRAWWMLRKLKTAPLDQSLEGEYTVVSDTSDKSDSD